MKTELTLIEIEFKPDMTHITSCTIVMSIRHTASAVFIAFWLVFPFREENIL